MCFSLNEKTLGLPAVLFVSIIRICPTYSFELSNIVTTIPLEFILFL